MKKNNLSSGTSVLKQALAEIVQEDTDLLIDTPAQPRSAAFEKKMQRLFRWHRWSEFPLGNTALKRTVAVAVLAVVLIASITISITPFVFAAPLPPNISFSVQQHGTAMEFSFMFNADEAQPEAATPPEKLETIYTIAEITNIDANFQDTEGYIKMIRDGAQKTTWAHTSNDGNATELTLTQTVLDESVCIEPHSSKYTVTAVNRKRAFLFAKSLILIWTDGFYVFTLQANGTSLSPATLTTLAEAVKPHPLSDVLLKSYHHKLFWGGQFSYEYEAKQEFYDSLP